VTAAPPILRTIKPKELQMYPHVTQPEARLRSVIEELALRREAKPVQRRRRRRRLIAFPLERLALAARR
jgi:hypothetical protein